MYDKEQINSLFRQYVETKDDKIFEKLIVACGRMIAVILSQCKALSEHFEDIKQDVRLTMWAELRKNPNLSNHLSRPYSFLYLKIRRYINLQLEKYTQPKELDLFCELSRPEERMVLAVQDGFVNPEKRYMLKELLEKYFRSCRKRSESHLNLREEEERLGKLFDAFEQLFMKDKMAVE